MNFQELLEVSSLTALNFFYVNLKEEVLTERVVDAETIYVASVLASYAQTSRHSMTSLPPMANLSEFFDNFVLGQGGLRDPVLLENAGAQSLLLAGFFQDQMRYRHDVRWYGGLGGSFYRGASLYSKDKKRKTLFRRISRNFPVWTVTCRNLSRSLRENRFLLK
ncbi:hypothetical protein A3F19_00310 [Candidatus Nomurabacteria bacterium RIFCSPHIGHO2_12_FULL_37_29]|uniref:Uncharacterized protein n=2 Tax=Parcubacteria group TaxID=1794811 RepID=A0A1G2UQD2_9BACT|nr:MAG: hypothetical protein A3F19_00310 [Candidatus Nomurabacteria bacterium RIFCSPHIGHO2_12_FULL_37_29]OHB11532.1 MAG: hypothetical protein A3H60_01465 [Candidatus Zambryskibacteria bacterium RIFCSPLOWO2_02_FULL_44_12b]